MKSFPDEVDITLRAGNGGPGCVSFLRARFQPVGRPDGGDGGTGGDVILETSPRLRTLADFRRRRVFQAENGRRGQSQDRHGKNGAPLIIPVPMGTRVFTAEGRLWRDLVKPGERLVVAKGGRGGKGNAHFTSSRLRSPRFSQPGEPGQERRLHLELQILADVGLVGAPNAGKTSLLKALTASRARVGAFPFTTLTPQLGVLWPSGDREPLILAEIPGLIPGAHLGKGLGDRFLRHLQRTRLLVQVIDLAAVDPAQPLAPLLELEEEFRAFDPKLLDKPRILALNKIDLLPRDFPREQVLKAYAATGQTCLMISAAAGLGLEALSDAIWEKYQGASHDFGQTTIPE
ncbi:MAG: GTPase ObgE [Deltaproteobacteria bacterium]|nr:GTPase ObgE [Deltaproteobacteria bacterium]